VSAPSPAARALRSGQVATVALLFAGYAAYYFCRADLSVAMPLLVEELRGRGLSADTAVVRLGWVSSAGVLELSRRPRRRMRVHAAVRDRRRAAALHARLGRQPPDAVDRLGGRDQGLLQVV
jgi:hypothetical protein